MNSLYENQVNSDLSLLENYWQASESFAFWPQKSGVSDKWRERALSGLPDRYEKGHFALLTSGSTGKPKIVIGEKSRSEKLVFVLHELQKSEPVAQTILMLPLTYCYAFVNQWLWAHRFNRKMIPTKGFSQPDKLLDALNRARDAMVCMVGAQAPMLFRNFGDKTFPGIIRLHFAGGAFPQAHFDRISAMFPNSLIFNNYGCAEAMPRLTLRPAGPEDLSSDIGRHLPGVKLKTGQVGELLFNSPYGAVAYIDDEGFHEIDDDEFVSTGDIGHEGENGAWVLGGRVNEVFKRYGEKIALPKILEAVGETWTGQAACYRKSDSAGEEGYVLTLSPVPSAKDVRNVLKVFRKTFPRTHWPLSIEGVSTMPLLSNGKIDYLQLESTKEKTEHWRQRI